MNRRNLLMTLGAGTAALVATRTAFAQQVPGANDRVLAVVTAIGSNHGHALDLTVEAVVLALQQARVDGSVKIDIQGKSGHPHTINLSFDDLVNLLSLGVLEVVSSIDAKHSHAVKISLVKVESSPKTSDEPKSIE